MLQTNIYISFSAHNDTRAIFCVESEFHHEYHDRKKKKVETKSMSTHQTKSLIISFGLHKTRKILKKKSIEFRAKNQIVLSEIPFDLFRSLFYSLTFFRNLPLM